MPSRFEADKRRKVIRVGKRQRCIDLRGEKIDGDLLILLAAGVRSPALRLDGTTITGDLVLRGDGENIPRTLPPDMVVQFEARGTTVGGDLRIEHVSLLGAIFNNARIGGDFRLTCVSIDAGPGGPDGGPCDALRARDLRVAGSMFIRGSAQTRSRLGARLYMAGAKIDGTVELNGVDFEARGKSMTMANAVVGGDFAWLANARFGGACSLAGRAKLDSCHVGGRLRVAIDALDSATLSLRACEIDAALQLYAQPGSVLRIDAGDASADAIVLHGYATPTWSLDVRGMHYDGLSGTTVFPAADTEAEAPGISAPLLDWFLANVVRRSAQEHREVHFSGQPYQAFVRLCRREGFDRAADCAISEWIERNPKQLVMRPLFGIFRLVSGYGLRPGRATLVFLGCTALCWATLAVGLRTLPQAFLDPDPPSVSAQQNVPGAGNIARSPGPAQPARTRQAPPPAPSAATFDCVRRANALVYALEVMLPISDFGQEAQCPLRGKSDAQTADPNVWWFAVIMAVLRIVGATLIAILLLTYSGINRRIWR